MTSVAKTKIKPLQVVKNNDRKTLPLWATLLIDIGLTGVQFVLEQVASIFLSPVAMVFVKVAGDIGVNLLVDYLSGYDPFKPENLVTSLLLPTLQLPSKLKAASKISKSNFSNIARILADRPNKADDIKWLKKMNKDLFEMENLVGNPNARKYQIIMDKYNATESMKYFSQADFFDIQESYVKGWLQDKESMLLANKVNGYIRKFNKVVSFIDPAYASRELTKLALKPLRNRWDKSLKKLYSKFNKVFGEKARRVAKKLGLIYFESEWIRGIKLITIPGSMGYFHVRVYFEPSTTNNKKPVVLYNVSFKKIILPWLEAPSKGKFYIHYICWGWEIGRAIRDGMILDQGERLWLDKIAIFNKYLSSSIAVARNIQFTVRQYKKLTNPNYWKENLVKSVGQGVIRGVTSSFRIPGSNLINSIVKTAQGQNTIPLQRYIVNTARKKVKRKLKRTNFVKNNVIESIRVKGKKVWT